MVYLILTFFAAFGLLTGYFIFKKWFNPVSIYTAIWYGMLFLFHLKLIRYQDLSIETWLYIAGAFFSLIFGALTVHLFRGNEEEGQKQSEQESADILQVFQREKLIKTIIYLFSGIGFFAAYLHWQHLLSEYGTLFGVLVHANEIYRLRVEGQLTEVLPYIHAFPYVALILASAFTAYKNKFSLSTFLPLFAILIKELGNMGRSNILLAVIFFLTTFFIVKYYREDRLKIKELKILRTASLFLIIVSFFIATSVFTRAFRGTVEKFTGTSKALSGFEDNLFISPSIYLYLTSHVAVFNKYLEMDVEDNEFAKYTFQPMINIFAKLGMHDKIDFYHKGYYIPVWTNTGTYLREMHSDFGIIGVLLVPYLIGFLITWYWKKFFSNGSIISLIIVVYLFSLLFYSFTLILTRFGIWYISLIILLIITPFLEYMTLKYKSTTFAVEQQF